MNNQIQDVDVVVVGGGISGLMAAMAAKSPDNRVLLVEPSNVLGGQGTAGGVAGFCGDTRRVNILFQELLDRLEEHRLINPYNPNDDRREYQLEWCAFFLQEMAVERDLEILLHSRVIGARAEQGRIEEMTISTSGGLIEVRPRFVVDASGICIVPVLTGFPVVSEGANKHLPMGLYFTLWDTGKPVEPFLPPGLPQWSDEDEIPMTSLHVFDSGKTEIKFKVIGFDAADGLDFSRAEMFARRQMVALIYFLQTQGYKGRKFDTHVLASVSRRLGTREERRIEGEHLLTTEEATHGTVFDDAIAVNTYHLDFHWTDRVQRAGTGITTMVEPYQIPLRCLIPKGTRNLLVPGRGASAEQLAMSSFRVMGVVQAMGFAAGQAVRQCLETGTDLSEIDIGRLQETLRREGQSLDLSDYGEYQRKLLLTHETLPAGEGSGIDPVGGLSLVQLANNRFLAAWLGESHQGSGVWLAERFQGVWSEPRLVWGGDGTTVSGPVQFRFDNDGVELSFLMGPEGSAGKGMTIVSGNQGKDWIEARLSPSRKSDDSLASSEGQAIQLADGALARAVCVSQDEDGSASVVLSLSFDGGLSWPHSLDIGPATPGTPATLTGTAVGMAVLYVASSGELSFWHGSMEQITMQGTEFNMHTRCPIGYTREGDPIELKYEVETV